MDWDFDTLSDNQEIAFDVANDVLVFGNALVQAQFLALDWSQQAGSGALDVRVTMDGGPLAGKSVILVDADVEQLAADNFSFAGGGSVLVGDNLHTSIQDIQGNALNGTASGDYLAGFGGDDTLSGGDGDDRFQFLPGSASGYGNDTVSGGAGFDLLMFDTFGGATLPVTASLALLTANGGYASSQVSFSSIEAVIGTHLGDTIAGDDSANWLDGAAGGDALDGAGGNDTLLGGSGNDALDGGLGTDLASYEEDPAGINANLGAGSVADGFGNTDTLQEIEGLIGSESGDFLTGSASADALLGAGGNDTAQAGLGADSILGGAGDDLLQGQQGADTLRGGAGNDDLRAGAEGDFIYSGPGDDVAFGKLGDDVLRGGPGNDTLLAGQDDDSLFGGADSDLLQGRMGNDALTGGAGTDRFRFEGAGAADADTILDFEVGVDEMELAASVFMALAAGPLAPENFESGAGVSADDPDDFVLYDTASGNVFYDADGSDPGVAQPIATLATAPATVTEMDFFVV